MKTILVLLTLLVSCNSSKLTSEQNMVSFDILLEHAIGGSVSEDIVVVLDQNTLEEIYSDLNSSQEPSYQIPEVNFETECIVVFFMGQKSTGGYSVSIKNIIETENYFKINYNNKSPKPTDMVTMALTQPYCIVKTKKSSKELKFIKVE